MRLVADRFVEDDDGRVLDLATGDRVLLTIETTGDIALERRWAVRCDALQKLPHRRIVPLVDFGAIGTSRRFEAWRCGMSWPGAREEAEKSAGLVRRFFLASGLTPGSESLDRVHAARHGAAVLPDESTGYPCEPQPEALTDLPLDARAVALIDRRVLAPLAEMFRATSGSRPHIAALWGPAGSGQPPVVRQLARTARINGFIPIAARFAASRYAELWQGRSLFVIANGA